MQTQHGATVIADRYVLEEELVRCAAGTTVRARDRLLGRDVAVTLIHPALGDDDTFVACLSEERKRVARVSGRGIARLLDTGEEDGVLFLVREHVDGDTARAVLRRDGPLDADVAVRVGSAVCDALALAHDNGVLHLAIGLDDVVITADGTAAITGLGIASAVVEGKPRESSRFIGGMAPEVTANASRKVDDLEIDARADVFAVGALVFELLTGEAPAGRSSPRAVRSDVPRAVDRLVVRALAPDPRTRFQNARAFSAALNETMRGFSVSARGDVAMGASPLDWVRTWVAAPFAIGAVAVAVIGVGLWFGRLEVGGPLGIRPAQPDPAEALEPTTQVVRPVSATTFDPFGDGGENDPTAPYAVDGDPSTAWRSENYFDGSLNKQGVGLVFDLGERRSVTAFRLVAPNAGYVFHVAVGDDPDLLLGEIGSPNVAAADTRGELVGDGRYVLVWITTVVPVADGIRAEIAEFRAVVEAA